MSETNPQEPQYDPSERTKYEPVPLPDQPSVSAGESLEGARRFEKMAARHSVRHYASMEVSEAVIAALSPQQAGRLQGANQQPWHLWPSVIPR